FLQETVGRLVAVLAVAIAQPLLELHLTFRNHVSARGQEGARRGPSGLVVGTDAGAVAGDGVGRPRNVAGPAAIIAEQAAPGVLETLGAEGERLGELLALGFDLGRVFLGVFAFLGVSQSLQSKASCRSEKRRKQERRAPGHDYSLSAHPVWLSFL